MKVKIVSATGCTVRGILRGPWYENRIGEEFEVTEIPTELARRVYAIPYDDSTWYKTSEGLINKSDTVPC